MINPKTVPLEVVAALYGKYGSPQLAERDFNQNAPRSVGIIRDRLHALHGLGPVTGLSTADALASLYGPQQRQQQQQQQQPLPQQSMADASRAFSQNYRGRELGSFFQNAVDAQTDLPGYLQAQETARRIGATPINRPDLEDRALQFQPNRNDLAVNSGLYQNPKFQELLKLNPQAASQVYSQLTGKDLNADIQSEQSFGEENRKRAIGQQDEFRKDAVSAYQQAIKNGAKRNPDGTWTVFQNVYDDSGLQARTTRQPTQAGPELQALLDTGYAMSGYAGDPQIRAAEQASASFKQKRAAIEKAFPEVAVEARKVEAQAGQLSEEQYEQLAQAIASQEPQPQNFVEAFNDSGFNPLMNFEGWMSARARAMHGIPEGRSITQGQRASALFDIPYSVLQQLQKRSPEIAAAQRALTQSNLYGENYGY